MMVAGERMRVLGSVGKTPSLSRVARISLNGIRIVLIRGGAKGEIAGKGESWGERMRGDN